MTAEPRTCFQGAAEIEQECDIGRLVDVVREVDRTDHEGSAVISKKMVTRTAQGGLRRTWWRHSDTYRGWSPTGMNGG